MKNKPELFIIKLGGSVITDKTKPFCARQKVISRLAREIKRLYQAKKNLLLIHGQGSFAHIPAAKYQTAMGLVNKQSLKGFCQTSFMAIEPNRILMKVFLKDNLPVATFSPLSFICAENGKTKASMTGQIKKAIEIGLIPVCYGDVIIDQKKGFCIFSGEKVIELLVGSLINYYQIKIIYLTDTDGVYDEQGKTIKQINQTNLNRLREVIGGAKGTDVTGGMWHKVKKACEIADEYGVEITIVNGLRKSSLLNLVLKEEINGTKVFG